MNFPRRLLPLLGLLLPAACSTPTLTTVSMDCADQDVVFFGEVHESAACHEQQRKLLIALREKRQDVVLSMEMFERDVQLHLDAYLAGKLPEAEFRKKARAWKNWRHYKPMVDFAAKHGLPVIAANAPKELVRQVSRKGGGGLEALRGNPHVAREVRTPKDAYYRAFVDVMKEHIGTEGELMTRMYEGQCVRDETMAESIADYLAAAHAVGRRPLVLHLCGNFHSNHRLGTVQRLLRRNPELAVKVIATLVVDPSLEYSSDGGDYRLTLTKENKLIRPPTVKPAGKHPKTEVAEEPDPNARPGLGFMPVYESDEVGCGVQMVMEGSAAAKAGIKKGDLIVKLAGEEIDDVRHYSDVLGGLTIGQKVKVVVKRDGKEIKLEAVVGESHR